MKAELQKKLFKKFPKIFRQKDLSPRETAMCWGIETGDGWYWLLDNLCRAIQNYCDVKGFQVEATQVKEKFGGLRFYVQGSDDVVEQLIGLVETMSYNVCEECGVIGAKQFRRGGWVYTRCKRCMKLLDKKK